MTLACRLEPGTLHGLPASSRHLDQPPHHQTGKFCTPSGLTDNYSPSKPPRVKIVQEADALFTFGFPCRSMRSTRPRPEYECCGSRPQPTYRVASLSPDGISTGAIAI